MAPSITFWPLPCGGLGSGPGRQVEAGSEMTLGGSPALCDQKHPSPSEWPRPEFSLAYGRRGRQRRWKLGRGKVSDEDWWVRCWCSSIIISQVWECETGASHSGDHCWLWEWMGRKAGCYRRAERNQSGGLDSVDYTAAAEASYWADRLIEIVHNKHWRTSWTEYPRNVNGEFRLHDRQSWWGFSSQYMCSLALVSRSFFQRKGVLWVVWIKRIQGFLEECSRKEVLGELPLDDIPSEGSETIHRQF